MEETLALPYLGGARAARGVGVEHRADAVLGVLQAGRLVD
jgi:hypothetical protein